MSTLAPHPTASLRPSLPQIDRRRPTLDRLQALKRRTLLLGLAALLCIAGGLHLAQTGLDTLARLSGWLIPPPPPDWEISADPHFWLPRTASTLLVLMALYGFSTGRFGLLHPAIVLSPLLLCVAVALAHRADGTLPLLDPEVWLTVGRWLGSTPEAGWRPAQPEMLRLAAGLMLAAAVLPLLQLWNRMRQRVSRLQHELIDAAQPEQNDSPSSLFMFAHGAPVSALTQISALQSQLSGWRLVRLLLIIDALAFAVPLLAQRINGSTTLHLAEIPRIEQPAPAAALAALLGSDAGPQPCALVGLWTASRQDSVYQVTLQEDGRFLAEPLARGRYAAAALQGDWQVENDRIRWRHDGLTTTEPDINPIREPSAISFTLVEVNGELTRYNLIHRTPGPRCTE